MIIIPMDIEELVFYWIGTTHCGSFAVAPDKFMHAPLPPVLSDCGWDLFAKALVSEDMMIRWGSLFGAICLALRKEA